MSSWKITSFFKPKSESSASTPARPVEKPNGSATTPGTSSTNMKSPKTPALKSMSASGSSKATTPRTPAVFNKSACSSYNVTPKTPGRPTPNNKRKSSLPNGSTTKRAKVDSDDEGEVGTVEDAPTKAPWLINVRDKQMRSPEHAEYDPTTLYIPSKDLAKMSPGQQQYWAIKSTNFDMILFFKMGKFYELFDLDAEIGAKEFDLGLMRGSRPHAGFPEAAFEKYAEQFIRAGYKVGRVEQTETPAELKERNSRSSGKNEKVVRREMVSVLTQGTLVDAGLINSDQASYLLAIVERDNSYGVCFVDTSTGKFSIGEFQDDRPRTRLQTLLAQIRPKELVFCKDGLQEVTLKTIKRHVGKAILNGLPQDEMLWESGVALSKLTDYHSEVPEAVQRCESQELALSAMGGIIMYLQKVLLDEEIMGISSFDFFDASVDGLADFLILDGHSLVNLEVLENQNGGVEGSLLQHMDHCVTGFGRRRLRRWLAFPLAKVAPIEDRLNAVEDLMSDVQLVDRVRNKMKSLPDLERLLSRIHSYGIGRDNKAVMYGNVNKKKVDIFLSVLDGYSQSVDIINDIAMHPEFGQFKSSMLKTLCTIGGPGGFPDLSSEIEEFQNSFDQDEAREKGFIYPNKGFHEEYDKVLSMEAEIESTLQEILSSTRTDFNDHSIKFVNVSKERYQLEISEATLKRFKGDMDDYQHLSKRKGYQRFWTNEIKELVTTLDATIESKNAILKDISRVVFSKFCSKYELWRRATDIIGELDCLLSLTMVSMYSVGHMCRPTFSSEPGYFSIKESRHPCFSDFIPNDISMASPANDTKFCIVTGPNMGGKSTLLRQTCVAVIMAQIGCFVPAQSVCIAPADRIFTRVGAQDRIFAGQSTFFVELEETAAIIAHATNRSLVILDELGRGTSTFDGSAIAYAVANHLIDNVDCRTLFSTHYHMLTDLFESDDRVSLYNMDSCVDEASETVTFLYKFVPGVCSRSFGMNVAKMAGLSEKICSRGKEMSSRFQTAMLVAQAKKIHTQMIAAKEAGDLSALQDLHAQARSLGFHKQ